MKLVHRVNNKSFKSIFFTNFAKKEPLSLYDCLCQTLEVYKKDTEYLEALLDETKEETKLKQTLLDMLAKDLQVKDQLLIKTEKDVPMKEFKSKLDIYEYRNNYDFEGSLLKKSFLDNYSELVKICDELREQEVKFKEKIFMNGIQLEKFSETKSKLNSLSRNVYLYKEQLEVKLQTLEANYHPLAEGLILTKEALREVQDRQVLVARENKNLLANMLSEEALLALEGSPEDDNSALVRKLEAFVAEKRKPPQDPSQAIFRSERIIRSEEKEKAQEDQIINDSQNETIKDDYLKTIEQLKNKDPSASVGDQIKDEPLQEHEKTSRADSASVTNQYKSGRLLGLGDKNLASASRQEGFSAVNKSSRSIQVPTEQLFTNLAERVSKMDACSSQLLKTLEALSEEVYRFEEALFDKTPN